MNDHVKSIKDIFSFNSTMVRLGLEDLTNEDATHQMRMGDGSSISFLVEHMLASRFDALKMIGVDIESLRGNGGGAAPIPDSSNHTDISELARLWIEVSKPFDTALEGLSESDFLAPREGFPVPDQTIRGALMFRAWHESYHVGQLGLIRTELGYPALRDRLRAEPGRVA